MYEPIPVPSPLLDLEAVEFSQDLEDEPGDIFEGEVILRFADEKLVLLPVRCPVALVQGELRNVSCSSRHLLHRGNLISIRARHGDAARIASEIQSGLTLIAQIERN